MPAPNRGHVPIITVNSVDQTGPIFIAVHAAPLPFTGVKSAFRLALSSWVGIRCCVRLILSVTGPIHCTGQFTRITVLYVMAVVS